MQSNSVLFDSYKYISIVTVGQNNNTDKTNDNADKEIGNNSKVYHGLAICFLNNNMRDVSHCYKNIFSQCCS